MPAKPIAHRPNATSCLYRSLAEQFARSLRGELGDRLTAIVLYGSVARGTARPESDIDLLVIAGETGKEKDAIRNRVWELESAFWDRPDVQASGGQSQPPGFEIHFLSKAQARRGTPIYLDMTLEAIVFHDPEGFFARRIEQARRRMAELKSFREWVEPEVYIWHLKAGAKPGEVFSLPYIEET